MQIRIANKQDETVIRDMFVLAVTGEGLSADLDGRDSDLKHLEWSYFGHDGIFLVAEEERQIVAYAGARKKNEMVLALTRIYVTQAHQNKGIGSQLLRHIIDFGRSLDYSKIELEPSPVNIYLDKFLQSRGFQTKQDRLQLSLPDIR